jgi:hypothetical protein
VFAVTKNINLRNNALYRNAKTTVKHRPENPV